MLPQVTGCLSMEAGALLEGKRFCHGGRNRVLPVWCLHLVVKLPSRITGLGNRTAPGRAPSPPPPAVARPAPSGPSSWAHPPLPLSSFSRLPGRPPVRHPGATETAGRFTLFLPSPAALSRDSRPATRAPQPCSRASSVRGVFTRRPFGASVFSLRPVRNVASFTG